jgi:hypothetical protein
MGCGKIEAADGTSDENSRMHVEVWMLSQKIPRAFRRKVDTAELTPPPIGKLHARWVMSLLLVMLPLGYALSVIPTYLQSGRAFWDRADALATVGATAFWVVSYILNPNLALPAWRQRRHCDRIGHDLCLGDGGNDPMDFAYLLLPVLNVQ